MTLLWQKLNKLAEQILRLFWQLLLVLAVLNVGVGGAVVVDIPGINSSQAQSELLHIQFLGLGHIHTDISLISRLSEISESAELPAKKAIHNHHNSPVTNLKVKPLSSQVTLNKTVPSLQASDFGLGALQKSGETSNLLLAIEALLALSMIAYFATLRTRLVNNPFLAVPEKPPQVFFF